MGPHPHQRHQHLRQHRIVQPTPANLMSVPNNSNKMNGHIDVEDISGITEITTSEYREVLVAPTDDNAMDDSVTRCVCDFQHDDGYMICCDRCRYNKRIIPFNDETKIF